MDSEKYRAHHEKHMMFNNGTSRTECGMLISSIPISVFISMWLTIFMPANVFPIVEFLLIVLIFILNVTIFSDFNHLVFLSLIFSVLAILASSASFKKVKTVLNFPISNCRSIITNFRASTNIVSAICILAVDFNVFPRRFAKTESFGFGLMDLGVGFFIFANGLVDRYEKQHNLVKVLKGCSVLLVLGLCRLMLVKSMGYHEHVTEYGIHWNFFFTLAFCRIFICAMRNLMNYSDALKLSLCIGAFHEVLLNLGLKNWVLSNAPRDSFLSSNREGVVSILGYTSLYFAASAIGKLFTNSKQLTYKYLLIYMIMLSTITWIGTSVFIMVTGISRRIVNLGYILWVISLSSIGITLFCLCETFLIAVKKTAKLTMPSLLEEVNSNGLFFFLMSNLLTGLINVSFQTLLLTDGVAMALLIAYMAILCSVTHYFFTKK